MAKPKTPVYLTNDEKREQLAWLKESAVAGRLDSPDLPELFEQLNAIPGVVTVQSCVGHRQGDHVESGHIELRLDHQATTRFIEGMGRLRRHEWSECASLHWRVRDEQRALFEFRPGFIVEATEALEEILAHDR
jgi:hypothetical protein